LSVLPGWQVPPALQPVQQLPAMQVPDTPAVEQGVLPSGTGPQTPGTAVLLHDRQTLLPEHWAVVSSQQTPSEQLKVSHVDPLTQAEPCVWYSQVSLNAGFVKVTLPPNMTVRRRAESNASAMARRGDGPTLVSNCQLLPFHSQVSLATVLMLTAPPKKTTRPLMESKAIP
jgi:hypothetical protein